MNCKDFELRVKCIHYTVSIKKEDLQEIQRFPPKRVVGMLVVVRLDHVHEFTY